jgi:hypothetical protein
MNTLTGPELVTLFSEGWRVESCSIHPDNAQVIQLDMIRHKDCISQTRGIWGIGVNQLPAAFNLMTFGADFKLMKRARLVR